jgi:hypothetical protein
LETEKRKNIRKRKSWEQEKSEKTDLIHRGGGGRRSHGKRKMIVLKD